MEETLSQVIRTLEFDETLTFACCEQIPAIRIWVTKDNTKDAPNSNLLRYELPTVISAEELERARFDLLALTVRRMLDSIRDT